MSWTSLLRFIIGCCGLSSETEPATTAATTAWDYFLDDQNEGLLLLQIGVTEVMDELGPGVGHAQAPKTTARKEKSGMSSHNNTAHAASRALATVHERPVQISAWLAVRQWLALKPEPLARVQMDKDYFDSIWFIVGFGIGGLCCGLLPLVLHAYARSIRKAIEAASKRCGAAELGVDIDMGKLDVHLFEGYMVLHGVTFCNPPGYSSDYLMKVKKARAEINVRTLFCSNFRNVIVENVVFKGVDIVYDQSARSSNVNDVLSFAALMLPQEHDALKRTQTSKAGQGVDLESNPSKVGQGAVPSPRIVPKVTSTVQVTLRAVRVEDVVLRMGHETLRDSGLCMPLEHISYEDFSHEVGCELPVHAAARGLLRSVLRRVRAIAAKRAPDGT